MVEMLVFLPLVKPSVLHRMDKGVSITSLNQQEDPIKLEKVDTVQLVMEIITLVTVNSGQEETDTLIKREEVLVVVVCVVLWSFPAVSFFLVVVVVPPCLASCLSLRQLHPLGQWWLHLLVVVGFQWPLLPSVVLLYQLQT